MGRAHHGDEYPILHFRAWATPDSTLVFCTTLAMTAYVWSVAKGRDGGFAILTAGPRSLNGAHEADEQSLNRAEAASHTGGAVFRHVAPWSWTACFAIYGAMGLAILAKGPIGLIAPTGCLMLFMLLSRSGRATTPCAPGAKI